MFHASVGKAGKHHHVVLGKRKRLGKIVREILDAVSRNLLDRSGFSFSLFKLRFADVQSRQSRRVMNFLEWPCRKSEEIRADGLCLGKYSHVCNYASPPAFRGCPNTSATVR